MANVSELTSEAGLRSRKFAELGGSSILFCRAEVVGVSQNVASADFRCLKNFDLLATVSVRGGSGDGKGSALIQSETENE